MTKITLNGDAAETAATTLRELIEQTAEVRLDDAGASIDGARLGIALAVDGAVVPRSRWAATPVNEDSEIEIVTAKQGG
ncbi:sulfur carrier protein ThiS [Pseudoclavibacter soli]|uniref:sulfur carrier protein ThiS n=1 Tax=Pseudoclavibacter soli TaxID=452623 RepID=UPI000425B2CA|nr:sulfur carrier protein ThiS [Pseudoclavibacter soli]